MRPGPERIPPAQAPDGMVFRVYDQTGALLIDRALRPGAPIADLAEIDATKTKEARPERVVLVAYDGDSGERLSPEGWQRALERVFRASYRLLDEGRAIECLCCGMISSHPEDVCQRYCRHCHRFHDDPPS
jgi:hypothetical protein